MLLSRQLLIIVKANASLSSHALMLLAHVVGKGGIPIVICVIVGAIGLISIPSTNNHNFFVLKINVSLCLQILKYNFPNFEMGSKHNQKSHKGC
jgi:hypothetical protein